MVQNLRRKQPVRGVQEQQLRTQQGWGGLERVAWHTLLASFRSDEDTACVRLDDHSLNDRTSRLFLSHIHRHVYSAFRKRSVCVCVWGGGGGGYCRHINNKIESVSLLGLV